MTALFCIAVVAYLEARGEGFEGMPAVADVIVTRAERRGQQDDICGMVSEHRKFAFDPHLEPLEPDKWSDAIIVAADTLKGDRLYMGADHFYSNTRPYWSTDDNIIGRIGNHTFVDSER